MTISKHFSSVFSANFVKHLRNLSIYYLPISITHSVLKSSAVFYSQSLSAFTIQAFISSICYLFTVIVYIIFLLFISCFNSSLLGKTVWYLLANICSLFSGSVISTSVSFFILQRIIPIVLFSLSNFTKRS